MKKWEHYKEADLPAPVPPPNDCQELTLRKPFGGGTYQMKYNVIKKAKNSTLIEAYTKLVRVQAASRIYWEAIDVEAYERRVETRLIEQALTAYES